MKKIVTLLLVVALCFGAVAALGACAQKTSFHVDVFYYDYTDTYIATVREKIDARLKGMGISYTNYDGAKTQATQTNQIETALAKGTNLLVVNLVETSSADAAQTIVDKAKAKGVKVIFFNREPVKETFTTDWAKENVAFIGTQFEQAGYMQGEMIAKFLMENETAGKSKFDKDSDGKLNYIMMRGEMSNNEAIARTLYSVLTANKVLKDNGRTYYLVASEVNVTTNDTSSAPAGWAFSYGGESLSLQDAITKYAGGVNPLSAYCVDTTSSWSAAKATDMLDTIFGTYANALTDGKTELFICNNDGMAEGVIASLAKKGYNTATYNAAKYAPVFGVDATSSARALINGKQLTGSISQDNVAMAAVVIDIIANGAAGESLMAGTLPFVVNGANKNNIRIPYAIYTGEGK